MSAKWKHDDEHVCDESRSDGMCACPPIRPSDDAYRKAAKLLHHDEGTLEIDDDALVSRAEEEDGCYVEAWVWVYKEDAENAEQEGD